MRPHFYSLLLIFWCEFLFSQSAGLAVEQYRLPNGFTVILNPDPSATQVFGGILVKAGSKNDPPDATGIAHYLEHLLFKGTSEMGTLDYQQEKPLLDSINLLYDELSKLPSPVARQQHQLAINRLAVRASSYGLPNEFDKLLKSIGSTEVNAYTTDEITFYQNYFPAHQIVKWLELYSHRFQNPVFRSFQSELEVVYEEKNRAMDNMTYQVYEAAQAAAFPDHPLGTQTTLGSVTHLKNPSLTKMYDFFRTYYVAGNMALVICGNFDAATVKPPIERLFGNWRTGEVPAWPHDTPRNFKGREQHKVRLTPVPAGFLGFRSPGQPHPDRAALEVCTNLLFNEEETGLINRLQLENKVMYAGAAPFEFNEAGTIAVFFVPKILRQSLRKGEKFVWQEIEKLKQGHFDEQLMSGIKLQLYNQYQRKLENLENRTNVLGELFSQGQQWSDYQGYLQQIAGIDKNAVMEVANRYFGNDFLAMYSKIGFKKKPKLEKPPYQAVKTTQNGTSAFAASFEKIPGGELHPQFLECTPPATHIRNQYPLYWISNPINDQFKLQLRYFVGHRSEPRLGAAAELVNYAGLKGKSLPQLKQSFAALGTSYYIYCSDHYLTIQLEGRESGLRESLVLLEQFLEAPSADAQAFKRVLTDHRALKRIDKRNPGLIGRQLRDWVRFGEQSSYLTGLALKNIKQQQPEALMTLFQETLRNYKAGIHFSGNTPIDSLANWLSSYMPSGKAAKEAPYNYLPAETPKKPLIYFIHNPKLNQSQVWTYLKCPDFKTADQAKMDAFNSYFGDGFNGLVMQEVREYRSLAYAAWGGFVAGETDGAPLSLITFAGCQADKTAETVLLLNDLIRKTPEYPDRMGLIKTALREKAAAEIPSFRSRSLQVEDWSRLGLSVDPKKAAFEGYPSLSFDAMMDWYRQQTNNQTLVFTVYGDRRKIDWKALEKLGQVVEKKWKDVARY